MKLQSKIRVKHPIEIGWLPSYPPIPEGSTELEFTYDFIWENTGIGYFEQGSKKCFDKGEDYLTCEDLNLTGLYINGKHIDFNENLLSKEVLAAFYQLAEKEIDKAKQKAYDLDYEN